MKPLLKIGVIYRFTENSGYCLGLTKKAALGTDLDEENFISIKPYKNKWFAVIDLEKIPAYDNDYYGHQTLVQILIENKKFFFRMRNDKKLQDQSLESLK